MSDWKVAERKELLFAGQKAVIVLRQAVPDPALDQAIQELLTPIREQAQASAMRLPAVEHYRRILAEHDSVKRRLDLATVRVQEREAQWRLAQAEGRPGVAKTLLSIEKELKGLRQEKEQADAEAATLAPVLEQAKAAATKDLSQDLKRAGWEATDVLARQEVAIIEALPGLAGVYKIFVHHLTQVSVFK